MLFSSQKPEGTSGVNFTMGMFNHQQQMDGSEDHYQNFQELISGNLDTTVDKYHWIFHAQVLGDSAFSYTVMDIIQNSNRRAQILGICG